MKKLSFVCAAALATLALSASAQPQTPPRDGPSPGWGPGMMGGGGMMGGYGYGRGGMMGLGALQAMDLSNEQLGKINQIQDETRRKNWGVMGKLIDEQSHMRDLFLADRRDPAAIGKQAMKIADLRRQMLEASVDAHNRVEALLSKEQREQLRNGYRRGWMMGDD
jgi:Spy/CpxP family protein refolding chaperone